MSAELSCCSAYYIRPSLENEKVVYRHTNWLVQDVSYENKMVNVYMLFYNNNA